MISREMYQVFDWSEGNRRLHYGRLKNAWSQMVDLQTKLWAAQKADGFLDMALRDRVGDYWIALTRPGMPDTRPGFPRRDLDLIEYLIEWATGVRNQATAEMAEMDDRYPELAHLRGSELMPASMVYKGQGRPNRLKRAFTFIFGWPPERFSRHGDPER